MVKAGLKSIIALIASLQLATGAFADDETTPTRDNSKLAVFVQPAISFLSFDERSYFQNAIDTIYSEFRSQAIDHEESLYVAKQNFQKVNFCFPITAGIQYQFREGQFLSTGIGFIYDNESVVLSDRKNNAHNYSYTIQGVPLFLEYRLAIPTNLITLSNGGLFSLAIRWYWTLPGTEIYSTWGKIEADNKPWGAGFGVSLGYLIASWNGVNIFGDIGFSSISVKSKETFADIVPDGPDEKAEWDIGGLQLQIRVSLGVINNPKRELPKAEETKGPPTRKTKDAAPEKPTTEKLAPAETPAAEAKSAEPVTGTPTAEKQADEKPAAETPATEKPATPAAKEQ